MVGQDALLAHVITPSYSAVEEQEAEMIASLVLDRVELRAVPRDVVSDSEVAAVIGRLESTLGRAGQQHG
jgi:hypothetical protein